MSDNPLSARQTAAVKEAVYDLTRARQIYDVLAEAGEDVDERLIRCEHLTRALMTIKKHWAPD